MSDRWMSCSACRADIAHGARHFVCSVSTCNRSRTRLVFCTIPCWDSHVAVLRHRDAWAVEAVAPSREAWAAELAAAAASPPASSTPNSTPSPTVAPRAASRPEPLGRADESDVLIVVSRLKKYIRDRSGMNTSDAVAAALSDHVRAICDVAIRTAGAEGRKTVLDRDVPPVRR
jgi:hypothetical protein